MQTAEINSTDNKIEFGINDQSLDFMASLLKEQNIDIEMLKSSPVSEASKMTSEIVANMKALDGKNILQEQKWFHKFTGADLEAKLKFEIGIKTISNNVSKLREIAMQISHLGRKLLIVAKDINENQPKIAKIINLAKTSLNKDHNCDPFLRERFERMLGNLMAYEASNMIMLENAKASLKNLKMWQDRILEITNVLFPVWQNSALGIIKMEFNNNKAQSLLETYAISRENFINKLL